MKKTAIGLGKRLMVLALVTILVALTACGGGTTPPASSTPPASAKPPASSAAAPGSSAPPSKVVVVKPPVTGPPVIVDRLIVVPKDGSTVVSNVFQCQLFYSNFNIVAPPNPVKNNPGDGHLNFYLDVDPVPIDAGKPAVLPSPLPSGYKGKIARAWDSNTQLNMLWLWKEVPNGNHTLGAQLVNNDDTPLSPPVWDKVTIVVNGPFASGKAPSPSPTAK